jgi:hypothetical protein
VAPADLERVTRATLPPAAAAVPDLIPFDAHTRTAIEHTFAVAQRLGAEMVGSGHLLLSLLDVEDGTGVLAGLGVDSAAVETYLGGRPAPVPE